MQATAENLEIPRTQEHYGRSMSATRRLGNVARAGLIEEMEGHTQQLKNEFESCIFEGLSSDAELGEALEVTKFDQLPVINGQVHAKDGKTSMVEITKNGADRVRVLAEEDRRWRNQYVRQVHDNSNDLEVDDMAAGKTAYNTRLVVTPCPEEAIARDGQKFWKDIGYIPEKQTDYIQLYHSSENGEMVTGSLSVDSISKERWRVVFAKHGIEIPEDETTDNWLQYAITAEMSEAEARRFALELREEARRADGAEGKVNTSQVLEENQDGVDQVFEEACLPLAESLAAGQKTEEMARVVDMFLQQSESFSHEVRRALIRTHNKISFDEADARIMLELSVYAAIEKLRPSVEDFVFRGGDSSITDYRPAAQIDQAMLMQNLVQCAVNGARAGRNYSSCGASIKMSNSELGPVVDPTDRPQEVYGGKIDEQPWYGRYKKKNTECVNCKEQKEEVGEASWCESCIGDHCG